MEKTCEDTNSSIPCSQGSMKYATLEGNGKDEQNVFFIPWSLHCGLWSNVVVFVFEVQVLMLKDGKLQLCAKLVTDVELNKQL